MKQETSTELRETQTALQKLDDSLALMMQNQAIKAWNNIVISENETLIFFFGVRSNPKLHSQAGGKNMPNLIDAQIGFRLHPSRKSREDIYQTINEIRRTINSIANTLAMDDDSETTLNQIKQETAEHQKRATHFQQAGQLLQTVYLNLKRFTLLDMVGYVRQQNASGTGVEQEFLQNGIRLFTFIEDKSSDPGQQQLLPISTCIDKLDNLIFTLSQYPNTCEELAESTSHLVPAVITDRFIAPVGQLLQKVKSDLQNKEGMLDKLTTPVQDAFSRLNRTGNSTSLHEYFKEIEEVTGRVKIALTDLGRHDDFLTVIDTSNAIISEATAFSVWLRNMGDDLEEEFQRPHSPLNIQHNAEAIRRKYATGGGLITLIKRFFSVKLQTELIASILKTCPVQPASGNKGNIKEMKDTSTLNSFLHKRLRQFEKTMVHNDIDQVIRQGISQYAQAIAVAVAALPLNSSSLLDYYDCGSLLKHLLDPTRLGKKH